MRVEAYSTHVGNPADQERADFADRLQQALRDANYRDDSPTELARQFNARYSGQPVSVHAARKWLLGDSIPSQEKLRVLADMLGVSAEWLRYGGDAGAAGRADAALSSTDARLMTDIRRLSERDRAIVRDIVRSMVRTAGKVA